MTSDVTKELKSIDAADLTGNGYMDIISASYGDNKIAWVSFLLLSLGNILFCISNKSFLNLL